MRPLAMTIAGAAVAWTAPALAPVWPPMSAALRVPRRLEGSPGVALTFDDGPHPEGTPAVLDALDDAGARATFFLVGEQVERHPAIAAEVARRGHVVAVHGHRHRLLLRVSPWALAHDLDRAAQLIGAATGHEPALYRPPYGIFSPAAVAAARARGWTPLLWSRHGRDWAARSTPASIAARATRDLGPGDVVLLHDSDAYSDAGSWRNTLGALPRILEELAHRGLPAVTVECRLVGEALAPERHADVRQPGGRGAGRDAQQRDDGMGPRHVDPRDGQDQ
jgi:peptidoglycan/xylan/chitin deacetylase (PgdA/CDA1 family)